MALADDVRAAIEKRVRRSPTSLTARMHGPVVVPPKEVEAFAELQHERDELLDLARAVDLLLERF